MATNAATLFLDIDSRMAVDAAKKLQQMGASADKAGREADRLAAKFDKNYVATKKLTQEYKDLDAAFNVGYINAQQYADGIQRIDAAMETLKGGASQAAGNLQAFDKGLSSSTHHATNLMFQMQDIGMMMAAGQNPFMLMMQQGSQVAGIFGQMQAEGKKIGPTIAGAFTQLLNPMTAVTFAVIGGTAALTQWAVSALNAGSNADTLGESIDDLLGSLGNTKSAMEAAKASTYELRMEYGAMAGAAREALNQQVALAQFNLTTGIRATQSEVSALGSDIAYYVEAINDLNAALARGNLSYYERSQALEAILGYEEEITDNFNITVAEADALVSAISDLGSASGLGEVQVKTANLIQQFIALNENGAKLPPEMASLVTELGNANLEMIDLIGLAGQLGTVLSTITVPSFAGMDFGNTAWYWGQSVSDIMPPTPGLAPPTPSRTRASRGRSGGRSGGGVSEAERIRKEMEDRVKALQESWMTENEIITAQYTKDQETLQWALDNKLLAEDEYNRRRVEMTRQYEAEINGIRYAQYASAFDGMSSIFGAMAELQGKNNEKMLKAQRTAAAASALINAYEAGSQVLRDPTLPWFAKIGAAGSIIAAGLGMVSAIKGGGSGGGRSSSTPATPASKSEPVKNVYVKLEGDQIFMDMAENIMQQIYRQSENGRVIIARGA